MYILKDALFGKIMVKYSLLCGAFCATMSILIGLVRFLS